ncbi:MAG: ribulose-phosphate 3-epimerase [Oscillospiraceae bacterium]|nr:ribulose-phosphate 3-epimerase [Oscillospiraceae bacterium]
MVTKISPSILASDFSALGEEALSVQNAGADMLHIDVMDGHFVPNITLGAPIVKCLRSRVSLPFDVHLMISDPLKYIPDFAKAGADLISFHLESGADASQCVSLMENLGVQPAIALKPSTPGEAVFPYLESLKMVLVMTVEPGFGGQKFMDSQLNKIRLIRNECDKRGLKTDIQVDGGITDETVQKCALAGANVFVAGSFIFGSQNREKAIKSLRTY